MVRIYQELYKSGETGSKRLEIKPNVGLLRIEINGSGTLIAKGVLDKGSTPYLISAIKCADYSKVTSMSEAGLYILEVSGLRYIDFELSGSATVNLKQV